MSCVDVSLVQSEEGKHERTYRRAREHDDSLVQAKSRDRLAQLDRGACGLKTVVEFGTDDVRVGTLQIFLNDGSAHSVMVREVCGGG